MAFRETLAAFGSLQLDHVARVGNDFNGDGQTDILWHNSSGQLGVWYLSGIGVLGTENFAAGWEVPDTTGWQVVGK